jgi:hypothetical protein
VRYVEVRFAPQLLAGEGPERLSVEDVLRAVHRGLARASDELNAKAEVVSGAEPGFRTCLDGAGGWVGGGWWGGFAF